jgi:hypothetical protein
MKYRFLLIAALFCCSFSNQIWAQENKESSGSSASEHENFKPHSSISLVISHANIFNGTDENGKKQLLDMASWGLDYNYHFSPKWAIGLHTDIILESYKVEGKEDGEVIERSSPIAPALLGIYKPNHHWSLMAGAGAEFAKEDNFFLIRVGGEYGVEIRNGWEVFGSLAYDIKWGAYDTWILGMGISKAFGGHHKHE